MAGFPLQEGPQQNRLAAFREGHGSADALRKTWDLYERGGPVPVQALVEAWGGGYGDCAEAFSRLQEDQEAWGGRVGVGGWVWVGVGGWVWVGGWGGSVSRFDY